MIRSNTRFFEIVKHYASVLRSHFRWVSCHVLGDGKDGIVYRERSGSQDGVEYETPSKVMTADHVIAAGQSIEEHRRWSQ